MRDVPGPDRILLAVDFVRSGRNVVAFARAFALAIGAEVDVLHVDAVHPPESDESTAEDENDLTPSPQDIHRGLKAIGDELTEAGIPNKTRCVYSLAVAPTILTEARSVEADFIIVGTHGTDGVRRFLVGSVSDELLRTTDRPLVLVNADETKPADDPTIERILVPVDVPSDSAQIDIAAAIAGRSGSAVHVLHTTEPLSLPSILTSSESLARFFPPEQSTVEDEMARIRARFEAAGITVHTSVVEGSGPRLILAQAEAVGASLVLLSRHDESAIQRFMLAITTERLARTAGLPVMITPDYAGVSQ